MKTPEQIIKSGRREVFFGLGAYASGMLLGFTTTAIEATKFIGFKLTPSLFNTIQIPELAPTTPRQLLGAAVLVGAGVWAGRDGANRIDQAKPFTE